MKPAIRKLAFAIVLCLCLVGLAKADLSSRLNAIIGRASQKKVEFAVHIVKADTGRAVYSRNTQKPMPPASNMKLITTAAALELLGADFEYKTIVALYGDTVIVIGGGDPLLGDKTTDKKYDRQPGWIFHDVAEALKEKHISEINDIIVDTSIFDDQLVHPNWPPDQLNRWYACEVSGLNYNGNCIDIKAQNINGRIKISTAPTTGFLKITNKIKPIRKGKSAIGSYRLAQPNNIVAFGKCKKKQGPFRVAIQRPAAFFGFLLAEYLATEGITTKGRFVEMALNSKHRFRRIAEFKTPIVDCIARANKGSFGLAAECMLKTIAAYASPDYKNGTWLKGQQITSKYLIGLGIDQNQFYIDDASGLSKKNKLSTGAITAVLHSRYRSKDWLIYKNSLAVAGIDGTIAKYFKDKKYRGKIFGKTGYITGVKSFSGLASTNEGDYIFSILTNKTNAKTRRAINDIAKAIIDEYAK